MLVTLAIWTYVTALTYVYGALALRVWSRAAPEGSIPGSLVCLVGFAVLGAVAGLSSLFGPFNAGHHVALIAGAIAALASRQIRLPSRSSWRGLHPVALGAALVLTAAACERATTVPSNYDTGLYHAQAIRWIEEYGIAPGLGNLHFRFAFDSAYFPVQALFGFACLGRGPFHVLAAWVFACGVAFMAAGLGAVLRREGSVADTAQAVLLPLGFAALSGWLSSPAPDIVVAVVLWVVLTFAYGRAERGQLWAADGGGAAIVILCVFLATVKLSALPAVLFPVVLAWKWRSSARRNALLTAACAVVLSLPFLARNLILSGFPLFVAPSFDPFHLEWEVPAAVAKNELGWIMSWARVPHRSPAEVLRMTPLEWLPLWAPRLSWSNRVLLGLLAAAIALTLPGWLRLLRERRSASPAEAQKAVVLGVAIIGSLYWFALAPDPRFGVGFYAAAATLLTLELSRRLVGASSGRWLALASLAALAWQMGDLYVARADTWTDMLSRVQVPRGYPVVPMRTGKGANFEVAAPQRGNQCWYEPFPCTPYPSERTVRRGADWRSGFTTTPSTP